MFVWFANSIHYNLQLLYWNRVKGQDVAFEPAKLLWLIQRDFLRKLKISLHCVVHIYQQAVYRPFLLYFFVSSLLHTIPVKLRISDLFSVRHMCCCPCPTCALHWMLIFSLMAHRREISIRNGG